MTFKGFIKKLLCSACVYFTLIMLLYIIFSAIQNVSDEALWLEAGRTVLFFFFALFWALANTVFSIKSIGGGLRLLIHYVIMMFAVFLFLLLPLADLTAPGYLIGFVLFSAIYFAVMGIIHLITSKYRANAEKSEAYTKQYSRSRK